MESLVTQAGLGFLIIFVIGFLAVRAWTQGVLGMLWAITGVTGGLMAGYLVFDKVNDLLGVYFEGGQFPFFGRLALAIFTGLAAYVVVRIIAKKILSALFNPDGFLGTFPEGLGGALLSLIPSAVTLVILFTSLRMGATIQELNHVYKLSTKSGEQVYTAANYPSWPRSTKVRNSLEGIPFTLKVLDPVDPVSRPDARNLAIITMISRDAYLLSRFRDDPESRDLFTSPEITALIENLTLTDLATTKKYFELLTHPVIRETARNQALIQQIDKLELERLLREFILNSEFKEGILIR